MLLLDTHVWLWSVDGDERRVGRRTRRLLVRAEARDAIRISPASIFELAALHALGRIRLALPPEQWIRTSLATAGVRLAELTPTTALDAGAIPRTALADPLDRLLVATARQLDAVLLTADEQVLDYAVQTSAVQAHDARS